MFLFLFLFPSLLPLLSSFPFFAFFPHISLFLIFVYIVCFLSIFPVLLSLLPLLLSGLNCFFFSCFILWFLSLFLLLFLCHLLFIFLYLLLSLFPLLCFLPSHLISFPCVLGMSFLLLFPLYVFPLLSLLLSLNFPLLSSVSLLP